MKYQDNDFLLFLLFVESIYSRLHKTDTSVKLTLTVYSYLSFLPLFDSLWDGHLSKTDT